MLLYVCKDKKNIGRKQFFSKKFGGQAKQATKKQPGSHQGSSKVFLDNRHAYHQLRSEPQEKKYSLRERLSPQPATLKDVDVERVDDDVVQSLATEIIAEAAIVRWDE